MKHSIITDLEGPVGVDSFAVTRASGTETKAPAMEALAQEVNACVDGILDADPGASVSIWDLHGTGGLRESDLDRGTYRRDGDYFADVATADALYFVGQHAMAGAAFAPLCHTYSSTDIAYYRLNGTFVGEFACRALVAGAFGVPTVFLSGDDKACLEATAFVPEMFTVPTKYGTGRESATHRDPGDVHAEITETVANAVHRRADITPLDGFDSPFTLEIRYLDPLDSHAIDGPVERIDDRTLLLTGRDLTDPDDPLYRLL